MAAAAAAAGVMPAPLIGRAHFDLIKHKKTDPSPVGEASEYMIDFGIMYVSSFPVSSPPHPLPPSPVSVH